MVVSCACFGAIVGIVRYLAETHGMDVWVIAFWRNLLSMIVFVPWFLRVGAAPALKSPHHGKLIWRALLMNASSTAFYFAAVLMPVAEATALSFTTPLFCILLATIFLHERVGPRRLLGLVVGMVGVVIILRPGSAVLDPAAGLPLLSALCFGGVLIIGRFLAAHESPEKIAAFVGLYSIPISLIPALFFWQWPTGFTWLWLLALGAAAALNMYALSRGLKIGEASQTVPWDFVRLPFVALVGFVWFAQTPSLWTVLGAAVILSSVLFVTWREARAVARARPSRSAVAD
jgi:drug/metabolite transporter (DMT)-like permease